MLKIITAEERMATQRGVKLLLVGPPGAGKTSQLHTLDPEKTLFLDFEAGDIALEKNPFTNEWKGWGGDQLRPKDWPECRDLACFLAGPDMNADPKEVYSQTHYEHVCEKMGGAEALDKYDTYFIDSITVAGRMCFAWSKQQPRSFNAQGKPDIRGAYGLHGEQMVEWVTRLQHTRNKNVIFVCLLDEKEDDFGRSFWSLQMEGKKSANAIPGIVDEVITTAIVEDEETGTQSRVFVTNPDNPWKYPSKDRSGRLEPVEEAHLGNLLKKLTYRAEA